MTSPQPSTSPLTAPKGTFDTLPPESATMLAARETLVAPVRRAGYAYIETPIFEDTALFRRGVGESTDVVNKEMYTFTTKGGDSLTLRPELTAGLMRAFIQHRLYAGQLPAKLYAVGPNFRYERPQAGRYRHFTQVNLEAIGSDDPALDAEVVALADEGFRDLGLRQYTLQLTSLGDRNCRPAYRELLQGFLAGLDLDDDTRRRAEINPLRVLDDKRPQVQAQLTGAPLMVDHLCEACQTHYDEVRGYLKALGVRWEEAPRLVRGLDYYTRTTFEFVHGGLGSQSAMGGGGRYDGLSAQLGGPDVTGVGWATGVDRTLLAVQAEGITLGGGSGLVAFVVPLGAAKARAVSLTAELRAAGIPTDLAYGNRGLKGAMKAADRSGARYAVVLGERDLEAGTAQLKDLATGDQVAVALADLATTIQEKLS
jgi:histidyl-tRNA synthetase